MQKMYIGFVKDLKNWEFLELIRLIDSSLGDLAISDEKYVNIELLQLATDLKSHLKPLLLLKHANSSHPLTAVMNEKLYLRTEYLACMRLAIETGLLWITPEVRDVANTLKCWLESYKKDLYRTTIFEQTNVVRSIINDKNTKGNIQEAITLLKLDSLLDNIFELTEEIMLIYKLRNREKSQLKSSVIGLRENAFKDLKFIVNAIPIAYNRASDEDKKELIMLSRSIGSDLKIFRSKLRSRRSKSKNRKEVAAAVKELIQNSYKPAPAQWNIPFVNFNDLRLIRADKPSILNRSLKISSRTSHPLQFGNEDEAKEQNLNANKRLDNLSLQ